MDLSAIERAMRATDAGVVIVAPRILRRVIKRHRNLAGIGLDVPHDHCYAIGRDALLSIVEPSDLGEGAANLGPDVILLPRPERVTEGAAPELLRDLWRAAFHAKVHLEVDRSLGRDAVSRRAFRERVHRIGEAEFDELRLVLKQDDLLLAPRDDRETYAELAAFYLEVYHFAPKLLERVLPALRGGEGLYEALRNDVDDIDLLARSKPEGTAELPGRCADSAARHGALPEVGGASRAPASYREPRGPLSTRAGDAANVVAERARKAGNHVRAALEELAAAAGLEGGGRDVARSAARADLDALAARLERAVHPDEADETREVVARDTCVSALFALAECAVEATGMVRSVEARALYELQKACIDAERPIKTVELIEWIRTFGRTPIVRALPMTREVRIARRLRTAVEKAGQARLDRAALANVLEVVKALREAALEASREKLRPVLERVLGEVGITAKTPCERVALQKLVDELLDVIEERGFISLGQVRDALSRNAVKLGNVTAREFFFGDALLEANQAFVRALDGVYRRGEVYLRALQKLSSLAFGTKIGRLLTLYAVLPVGVAYVFLVGVSHIGALIRHLFGGPDELELLSYASVAGLSVLNFALLHSARAREAAKAIGRAIAMVLRAVFVTVPRWVAALPFMQVIAKSRLLGFLYRFVLKPGATTALVLYVTPLRAFAPTPRAGAAFATFFVLEVVLNSRAGRLAQELAVDGIVRRLRWLTSHFFPELFRLIAGFFKRALERMERGIYAVDEWLRFREGENVVSLCVKIAFGFVWFFIAYVIRIYITLLIEPQINPIKHFPVVTVSQKIVASSIPTLIHGIEAALTPLMGPTVAAAIAGPTVFLLPGVFGFFVWEFKENFRLYEQNRRHHLVPASIGHHGETMSALLRPGLHSGTVPKLFAKLRRALFRGSASAHAHEEALDEVREAVSRFVERELVALLAEAPTSLEPGSRVRGQGIELEGVRLAASRVRIELRLGEKIAAIHFEEQSGHLVASITEAGFVDDLDDQERVVFENALAGLYQRAGVHFVREQIERIVERSPYDIGPDGLVVWPGARYETEIVFPFGAGTELHPHVVGAPPSRAPAPIARQRLFFSENPIAWADFSRAFGSPSPERLVQGDPILPDRRT